MFPSTLSIFRRRKPLFTDLPTADIPLLPPELLLLIADWSDPPTARNLKASCKTLNKFISSHLLTRFDASYYLTKQGEAFCWSWATKHGHTDIIVSLLNTKLNGLLRMESASEERQVGWKQYRRYVDGALITAAGLGHADIVQLLLQGGALVNEGHGAVDPIVLFRAYSRAKREAMLVDMGENASWFNVYRQSDFAQAFRRDKALRRAVLKGHTQIVRLLLEAQAEIRDENDFLLRDAARFGHVDIVKLLLEAGADVHASRDDALTRAAIGGHVEVVLALLEAGADMRARKSMAYQGALDRRQTDVVRVFHSLVPARRPIDVVMERGWNAVDWVTVLNVVMTALLMYNFQPFRMAYLALVILYGNYPTGVEFTDL